MATQASQGQNEGCKVKGVRLDPCDLLKLVFVRVLLRSQLASECITDRHCWTSDPLFELSDLEFHCVQRQWQHQSGSYGMRSYLVSELKS